MMLLEKERYRTVTSSLERSSGKRNENCERTKDTFVLLDLAKREEEDDDAKDTCVTEF